MSMDARRIALIATAAFGVQGIVLGLLHVLPTGYHPFVNFISEYALGGFAPWMALSQIGGIVGLVALIGALDTNGILSFRSVVGGLFALHVVSRLLGLVFTVDPIKAAFASNAAPQFTTSGWIHAVSGVVGAVTLVVAMIVITVRLAKSGVLASRYRVLAPLCVVTPVAYGAMIATRPATFPAGLLQRIFIVGALAWLITLSAGIASAGIAGPASRKRRS